MVGVRNTTRLVFLEEVVCDCKKRLTGFQTGDPNRAYKIEFEFKTPYYREIEDYIHEKYKATPEWVEAELKEIIKEIENYKP